MVSFGFTGKITKANNPTGELPSGIAVGEFVRGLITYDTAAAFTIGENPANPAIETYYFKTNTAFSMAVTVAGHTFGTVSVAKDTSWFNLVVRDGYGGYDEFGTDNSLQNLRIDGAAVTGGPGSGFSMYLSDHTQQAITSEALPTTAPNLAAFGGLHRFELRLTDTSGTTRFHFSVNLEAIQDEPQPWLMLRPKPAGKLEIAWPFAARGFVLQSTEDPASGIWKNAGLPIIDTELEHVCTDAMDSRPRFYRLVKP